MQVTLKDRERMDLKGDINEDYFLENLAIRDELGTAVLKKNDSDYSLEMREEDKSRDHRKLGEELELFGIHEEAPGFPFFYPKGMVIRNILEDYWREIHTKGNYKEIKTPIMLREDLWHKSGHWDYYKENMYFTKIEQRDFAVKPMNCPGAILVYESSIHSYKELPLRLCELGLVHRHELLDELYGLMRTRCFTQDDAHLFMTREQIKEEVVGIMKIIDEFYNVFGFEYNIEVSTRPEDSMGSDEEWEIVTSSLIDALEVINKEYKINEGEGAFYGPKIDIHIKDYLGRAWQCAAIQLDFQMPERFDLNYIGSEGEKHRPVMIHRVVFGSVERFIGILIEHYGGAFPVWLAPVQVKILNITDEQKEYAEDIYEKLKYRGVRVDLDLRNEKIGYKIREAQLSKVPYMIILGKEEMENNKISVRSKKQGDLGTMNLGRFIDSILDEINKKRII